MLAHGMRKRGRCNNTCYCNDGNLRCTSLRCDDDADDDDCGRCDSQQEFSPVCGNGKEYRSSCHAMQCGGLAVGEFTRGRCPVRNAEGTVTGHCSYKGHFSVLHNLLSGNLILLWQPLL